MASVSGAAHLSQSIEIERKLAAVLAADVAGFSRLTEADEVGTMRMLAAQRAILDAAIARHRGRIANTAGDSVLAEFPSVVNAVQCAVEVQQALRDATEGVADDKRVLFRIGIHVGDVMVRGGDLLGGGVNVAARLEALADAGGIVLSAAAHEQVRKILPLAYTDLGMQSVKNIEEPVRAFAIGSAASASATVETAKPLPLPDKPSIAVLPFQNMSGDPEQEYFADGMVEDIITALSRFKSLFVIARNSSFTYKGKAVDIQQVGRALGVRYVLEGSVRKAGGRVRITGQLIEAATGTHIWAEKFDGAVGDIFDLQDQVTQSVVGAVGPSVERAEMERAQVKGTGNLGAYDWYMRGRSNRETNDLASNEQAVACYRRAIDLDPSFARAHARAANCIQIRLNNRWSTIEEDVAEGTMFATRAVALGQADAEVLSLAAFFFALIKHEVAYADTVIDQALSLNPNLALAWRVRGWISVWIGRPENAIPQLETAMRLDPLDPYLPTTFAAMGAAYNFSGRPMEALPWLEKTLARQPAHLPAINNMIIASFALGQIEDARRYVGLLLAHAPGTRISSMMQFIAFTRRQDLDLCERALRAGGLPE
jgi:adenylate cyclase